MTETEREEAVRRALAGHGTYMVGDEDQPATKGELRQLGVDLRGEMKDLREELRCEMKDLRRAIVEDVGEVVAHALKVQQEQFQAWAPAFDDKYQDLPGRVDRLEGDVDDLKGRIPPPAPPPGRRKAGR
jgi:hypothetical protein